MPSAIGTVGMESDVNGYRVSFIDNENVLNLYCGDDYTALRIYYQSLNYTFEMGKFYGWVNFMVYKLYLTKDVVKKKCTSTIFYSP